MKKTRKILAMAACAILLVCISVGATVAYLTSTDTVTNTFTVGNIEITLDEAHVDTAGKKIDETRVDGNTYKLMPGHSYIKDPTVRVTATSEDCYLFVKVVNPITAIEKTGNTTIEAQMAANGWVKLEGATKAENVYYLTTKATDDTVVAKLNNAGTNPVVFEEFVLADDANTTDAAADYANAQITITAYAVQADGFATAVAAWNATYGK